MKARKRDFVVASAKLDIEEAIHAALILHDLSHAEAIDAISQASAGCIQAEALRLRRMTRRAGYIKGT